MLNILAVFFGGGIGSLCRYGVSLLCYRPGAPDFPTGTLAANLFGSLLAGFFWTIMEEGRLLHEWRLFVFMGFLGGFTTFSAFTRETLQLIKVEDWKTALLYIAVSNVGGIALVFAGCRLARRLPWLSGQRLPGLF